MATLTLTLHAGDIINAVKADTYITGQVDKSADMVKNAALAYNEQAGDDSYHLVKLYRTMKGAVGKFEANMAEYVDPGSGESPVSDTLTATTEGSFTITIPVGSRFYKAFVTTLSTLAQEYIINMMLYSWWQSIKPAFAKDYYQFAQESLEMVRKTLSKTPPEASLTSYNDVEGTIEDPIAMAKMVDFSPHPETGERGEDGFYFMHLSEIMGVKQPIVYIKDFKVGLVSDGSSIEPTLDKVYSMGNGVVLKSSVNRTPEVETAILTQAIHELHHIYGFTDQYSELLEYVSVVGLKTSDIKGYIR